MNRRRHNRSPYWGRAYKTVMTRRRVNAIFKEVYMQSIVTTLFARSMLDLPELR